MVYSAALAANRHETVVQLLLRSGTIIKEKDTDECRAPRRATKSGSKTVM